MSRKLIACIVCLCVPLVAFSQVAIPAPAAPASLEEKDWGVSPTSRPKGAPFHAPTPTSIPGGRVIKTMELHGLLSANSEVLVIDVLDSKERTTVPGAHWMSGGGSAPFYAAEKSRFTTALDALTGGNKTRPLVFLCFNAECWLSYNASLYAMEAGYKDVLWYRGGTSAWSGASLPLKRPRVVTW